MKRLMFFIVTVALLLTGCGGGGGGGSDDPQTQPPGNSGPYTGYIDNLSKHQVEYVGLGLSEGLQVDRSSSTQSCDYANDEPLPSVSEIKAVAPYEINGGVCATPSITQTDAECVFPGPNGSLLSYFRNSGEPAYLIEVFHNGAFGEFNLLSENQGVTWEVIAHETSSSSFNCDTEIPPQSAEDLIGTYDVGIFAIDNLKPVLQRQAELICTSESCKSEGIEFTVQSVGGGMYGYDMTATVDGAAYQGLGATSPSGNTIALFSCSDAVADPMDGCALIVGAKTE